MRMTVDFGTLELERIILHGLPKWPLDEPRPTPALKEGLVQGSAAVRSRLTDGIRKAMNENSSTAIELPNTTVASDVTAAGDLNDLLSVLDEARFVELSKTIATKLDVVRPRSAVKDHLVAVATGTASGQPIVAVLNLESQAGVTAKETIVEEQSTFEMNSVENLILTENTTIHKAAIFWPQEGDSAPAAGRIRDYQLSRVSLDAAAAYFLDRFLGASIAEDNSIWSQQFFYASQSFVNDVIEDKNDRFSMFMALQVYLSRPEGTVSINDFLETHVDNEFHDGWRQALQDGGVPREPFLLNPIRVESRFLNTSIDLGNSVKLIGPSGEMEDAVTFGEDENGSYAIVRAPAAKISGRARG
jgi:hypothetical protein